MEILSNLNLNQNELQNAKLQILATDPVSPNEGNFWYNSTSKKLKYRTDTTTIIVADLSNLVGLLEYKGVIDASTNPNYPVGEVGDVYIFSVSGKIGGVSGEDVEVGDMLICNTDNVGGTEASVGTNWDVIQKNLPDNIAKTYSQTGISVGTTPGPQIITHNLGTRAVVVSIHDEASPYNLLSMSVQITTINSITISATGATRNVTVKIIA